MITKVNQVFYFAYSSSKNSLLHTLPLSQSPDYISNFFMECIIYDVRANWLTFTIPNLSLHKSHIKS